MCEELRRVRARFVNFLVSRNPDALLRLADHILQHQDGFCAEHSVDAGKLRHRCEEAADRMIGAYFA